MPRAGVSAGRGRYHLRTQRAGSACAGRVPGWSGWRRRLPSSSCLRRPAHWRPVPRGVEAPRLLILGWRPRTGPTDRTNAFTAIGRDQFMQHRIGRPGELTGQRRRRGRGLRANRSDHRTGAVRPRAIRRHRPSG